MTSRELNRQGPAKRQVIKSGAVSDEIHRGDALNPRDAASCTHTAPIAPPSGGVVRLQLRRGRDRQMHSHSPDAPLQALIGAHACRVDPLPDAVTSAEFWRFALPE